jgi:NADPH-dependent ferric siderophore reductase
VPQDAGQLVPAHANGVPGHAEEKQYGARVNRRPPPPFLVAEVAGREWLTPRLARVTLSGENLARLEGVQPASSVRVLLPGPDGELELPDWDGNKFVLRGGRRPAIRTLTPRIHDREGQRLCVDVVVHGEGVAARWAATASTGTTAAVSGPARGYSIDVDARSVVLGGDETAVPAISQILEALPDDFDASVFVEVAGSEMPPIPERTNVQVEWLEPVSRGPGQALADRLGPVDLPETCRLWAAGEAAAMQRIRQQLFSEHNLPRAQATIRGYWKHGRASEATAEQV